MEVKPECSLPFFSIIVPIYNAEKYLDRCISSIQKQSFDNYEVILVDDGSTDFSAALCQKYAANDGRFRYCPKENGGSFHARRFGINMARGLYLMFIDSDDFYATADALSILYNELKDETIDAIQFGYVQQYNHLRRNVPTVTNAFTLETQDFKANEYPRLVCSFYDNSHITTNVWNKAYHKNLFTNLPSFDNEGRIFMGDDQILNLFLLENCQSFRFIPDTLYCYQQGSGDTSKFSKSTMADLDTIKRYQLQFLDRYPYGNREKIENTLHSETAGWFYVYLQECTDHLNDNEVMDLIERVLKYDAFVMAREFYLRKTAGNSEAVNLLCKADPVEYLQSAKEIRKKMSLKRKIRKTIKRIYANI